MKFAWESFDIVWRECDECGEGEMWTQYGNAPDRAFHACYDHRWITVIPCDHEDD